MGFERIVSILQEVNSNYRTDLLWPLIQTTQRLTGQSDAEVHENFTPYRVIADHTRAAVFLIGDGVVPGNTGRNYITPHDHPARGPLRRQDRPRPSRSWPRSPRT